MQYDEVLQIFLSNYLLPSSRNTELMLCLTGSRYGCDPTGMSCSLQWELNTGYSICLLLLGGILPATLT
jgi:hypothetical protein